MKPKELQERSRRFAVQVLKLADRLPRRQACDTVATPMAHAGTNVGLMYLRTCRAMNPYDFLQRLRQAEESAHECCYWLSVLIESELIPPAEVQAAYDEGQALLKIFTMSRKVADKRHSERRGGPMDDSDIPF